MHRSLLPLLTIALLAGGCVTTPTGLPTPLPNRAERMQSGYLFYLDGAGGGTARKNWAGGVKTGLLEAGYPGAGEMYSWQTGEGLIADQDASVRYKREKAAGLATRIAGQARAYPNAPIDLLGFSAGTAEVIFALEALPPGVQVENVVLLGASISNDYDLTRALRAVRGKLFLFTSKRDRMLSVAMSFSGTADRRFVPGAGETGFVLPPHAGPATRKLYADKIVTISWNRGFLKDGDRGRHFDNVKSSFIRDKVAPLLMTPPASTGGGPRP